MDVMVIFLPKIMEFLSIQIISIKGNLKLIKKDNLYLFLKELTSHKMENM